MSDSSKKRKAEGKPFNPEASMVNVRHEFGEWGGVNPSIEVSSTFTVLSPDTMPKIFDGILGPNEGCYLYGRSFNPTTMYLGRLLAGMEGTEAAYPTASGMSAITGTIMGLCDAGDHIVSSRTIYGGTFALFSEFLPRKANITTTWVDVRDLEAVEKAITPKTKLIYTEAISNPTLRVADLPALSDIARRRGVKLVCDNTFSPMMLSPARLGADIVLHSLTKFVSGCSDIVGGAVCGSAAFIRSLFDLHNGALMLMGPTMDPRIASELQLRLPHLGLRIREHSRRALAMASLLEGLGAKVHYPGLESHPDRAVLTRMLNDREYGYGGMVAVDLGTLERAGRFMEALQGAGFGWIAVSLGYSDTLLSCSGASTSSELSEEDKVAAGISPGLVRMSIGISGTLDERMAQLEAAYRSLSLDVGRAAGVAVSGREGGHVAREAPAGQERGPSRPGSRMGGEVGGSGAVGVKSPA